MKLRSIPGENYTFELFFIDLIQLETVAFWCFQVGAWFEKRLAKEDRHGVLCTLMSMK